MPARLHVTLAIAAVLAGLFGTGTAGAQSACDALAGTLDPDQTCHVHDTGAGYQLDLGFPAGYPDQQALTDYLVPLRDDFVEFAQSPRNDRSYTLTATPTTYRAGGTEAVVIQLSQDADPHPVSWYRAFNYDLVRHAPITLDTLFTPGTRPVDVAFPAVRRELEKRWQPEVLADMLGDVDDDTFSEFALTDDAVIFFFGQGRLLGHPEGPLEVSVPRAELAPWLARALR
ncbi:esterase [Mycolicibacterium arseniciresistens]|uniref:RsiV family protein n=1 Tax=Mycolicibacterium arseniciresistens TaxID=3062257 RepID=A0ABT8UCD1_9MYCO|nr:esterase [Mycolicibacterium arseniciresistens]MDO3635431.1 RsiV family protein [Mycolicibacterium arseniciresistens]